MLERLERLHEVSIQEGDRGLDIIGRAIEEFNEYGKGIHLSYKEEIILLSGLANIIRRIGEDKIQHEYEAEHTSPLLDDLRNN